MKSYFLIICLSLMTQLTYAQDMKNFKLYNPYENVDSALKIVLTQAKKENKHVFVQIGGNWCVWCARFNDFVNKDEKLDSAMNKNFIVYHMNYIPNGLDSPFSSCWMPKAIGCIPKTVPTLKKTNLIAKEKYWNSLISGGPKHWTRSSTKNID